MREKVIKLREEGKSIQEICNILNIKKGTVGYYLKKYTGIYKNKKITKNRYDELKLLYTNEIVNLYKNNYSITFLSKKYNVSQVFIKQILINKNVYIKKNRKLDIKKLINGDVKYDNPYNGSINNHIKKYLLDNNLLNKKCDICEIEKWMNKNIIFDLDHIDGDRNNNIFSNLRLLCPNCHSQTETYKNKKR